MTSSEAAPPAPLPPWTGHPRPRSIAPTRGRREAIEGPGTGKMPWIFWRQKLQPPPPALTLPGAQRELRNEVSSDLNFTGSKVDF